MESRRKLEQGPLDHELDVRCKVYENGRVAADPETLGLLKQFSEREAPRATGLHRKPIRLLRHGGTVTQSFRIAENNRACRAAPFTYLVHSWNQSLGCTAIFAIALAKRKHQSCFLNTNAMEHCDGGRHHRNYQCRPGTGM